MTYNRSLELIQTDSAPEPAAGPWHQSGPGQGWKPEKKKASLAEMDLLEGPLWSLKPPQAILVTVAHAVAPGRDEA